MASSRKRKIDIPAASEVIDLTESASSDDDEYWHDEGDEIMVLISRTSRAIVDDEEDADTPFLGGTAKNNNASRNKDAGFSQQVAYT